MLENISFPIEFFQDEVRDGFYIPEMLKRLWAAQLVVLSEINKVCERHDIKWTADLGTLLGVVRHKGYIPWDDDLDISMLREDWERFFEYAKTELPEGYMVLNLHEYKEFNLSIGRITNGRTINTNKDHMKKYFGCPYSIGVDIFPMDRLYPDPKKEEERKHRGKIIAGTSTLLMEKGLDDPYVKKLLSDVERDNHTVLHRKGDISRELVLLFDKISRECRDPEATKVASMYAWIIDNWEPIAIDEYKEFTTAPFENVQLSITTKYDEHLSKYYGDYMVVKRGSSAHDYPCFADQEEMLRDNLGHNPYRYTFDKDRFSTARKVPRVQDHFLSPIAALMHAHEQIEGEVQRGNASAALALFQSCQDIAVTLGNLIEQRFGEGTAAVKCLEDYCEEVYQLSECWSDNGRQQLNDIVDDTGKEIRQLFSIKKKILFLPCRAKWWDSMKPLYEKALLGSATDVRVIPIPYYDCDYEGNIGEIHDESGSFPKDEHFTSFDEYDLVGTRPDAIVIQVPYDGASCSLTIPERLYSDNLLNYTDELAYIPCFDVTDPASENDPIVSSLRRFIEQPAVVNADKVILKSEAIRKLYLDVMTELAGEDTKEYWEQKMILLQDYEI